jgi:hypothetical protein
MAGMIPDYSKARSFKELQGMDVNVATEESLLNAPVLSDETKEYIRYGRGEDVDLGELTDIADLTDKISQNPEKMRTETKQVEKAQAIESIVGNLIKAFAAYGGLKSNTDMSGVDIKTGIDWKSVLQGKISAIEEEGKGLKDTREITRQRLSDRVRSAQQGSRDTAEYVNREAMTKWKEMSDYFKTKEEQKFKLDLEAQKQKEDKIKESKLKLSGFMQSAKGGVDERQKEARAAQEALAFMDAESDKDLSVEDSAKKNKAVNMAATTLGITSEQLQSLDKEQRQSITPLVTKAIQDKVNTANVIKNKINVAEAVGEKLTPEQLSDIKFLSENVDRASASIPEGKILLPIEGKPGDKGYENQVKAGLQYLDSDPEAKAKFLLRAKIEEKAKGGWFSDPDDVDQLQAYMEGKPVDYAKFPARLLPGIVINRVIKGQDIAKSRRNVIIGVGGSK